MYLYIMFLFLLMRLFALALSNINWKVFKLKLFNKKILNINSLFKNNFIDSQVLFATKFSALANISLINYIDTSKAYELIMEKFGNDITGVHHYNTFDHNKNKALFNLTILILKKERIIEIGHDYVEIFYTGRDYDWAIALLSDLANFKVTNRTKVMGFVNSKVMNEN